MSDDFLSDIERAYSEGELDQVKKDLELFIKLMKQEIKSFQSSLKQRFKKDIAPADTIKLFILERRSINPKQEIQEQLASIKLISKKSNTPEEQAGYEWAKNHSMTWRDHRTTSIIYIFEQNKRYYLDIYDSDETG